MPLRVSGLLKLPVTKLEVSKIPLIFFGNIFLKEIGEFMKILHGTWIPDETKELIQSGGFYLWVETTAVKKTKKFTTHPYQISGKDLAAFLEQNLGIKNLQSDTIK